MKRGTFLGDSRDVLSGFPREVRLTAGNEIFRVQNRLEPTDWKPLKIVGPGVRDIRIRFEGAYRVLYVLQKVNEVTVLHCFEKKSQKTPQVHIGLARRRLKDLKGTEQ